ncbi:MAG: hypothetical protein Q9164_005269, partial [Protoblastenia rupestris]
FLLAIPFLSALASAAAIAAQADYEGYQVVRLAVGADVAKVDGLIEDLSLSTWNGNAKANSAVDVVVPKDKINDFKKTTGDLQPQVMHENLGASIAQESDYAEYRGKNLRATLHLSNGSPNHKYQLAAQTRLATYPANSEIVVAGNSGQGRPITGIHLYGSGGKGSRPAIVFHSTVHAREWITTMVRPHCSLFGPPVIPPPVNEYFAFNLLSNYGTNAEIKSFVDKYDFYIFPVVNPDGFVYSQTRDRLWRKNRQSTAGSSCIGHDINRNWPYMWSQPQGASTNPCAQDFKGTSASSAPETKAHSAYINRLAAATTGLKMYIDWHSYSQLFMTPYGYSCTALSANNAEYQSLAQGVVAAIRAVYGTVFKAGPICSTIYQVSGGSVDYVADVSKAKYSFTAELRDTGMNGFVLPADQILPSAVEAYAGVRYLLQNIK